MDTPSNLRSELNAQAPPAQVRSSFRRNRLVPQLLCALVSLALILYVLRGVLVHATMGRWGVCVLGVTISTLIGWGALRGIQHLRRRPQPLDCLPLYGSLALLCAVVGLATWPSAPAPLRQALNAAPLVMLKFIAPFAATELEEATQIRAECDAAQYRASLPTCPQRPTSSDLR